MQWAERIFVRGRRKSRGEGELADQIPSRSVSPGNEIASATPGRPELQHHELDLAISKCGSRTQSPRIRAARCICRGLIQRSISRTPFQKEMTHTALFFDLFRNPVPVERELVIAPEEG